MTEEESVHMKPNKMLIDRKAEMRERFGVKRIGVFGSFAKGDAGGDSDIDILVEFDEVTFDHYMELLFYLEDLFGRKVDLVTTEGLSPYIGPHIKNEVVWCE